MSTADDLLDFNTKYQQYIECNKNPSTPCTVTLQQVLDSQNKVLGGLNTSTSDIYTKFQDNEKMRADLDKKLKELYRLDGSNVNERSAQYDSVMYISILFTILATIILYFTFIQL